MMETLLVIFSRNDKKKASCK
uniref:Uncharacterized protein n=1 Tax=Anguilla anguilla TaxID=7936 RepID=A0A0E9PAL7_ANGAN